MYLCNAFLQPWMCTFAFAHLTSKLHTPVCLYFFFKTTKTKQNSQPVNQTNKYKKTRALLLDCRKKKFELFMMLATGLFVYNAYHDGHILKQFWLHQKQLKMIGYITAGLVAYFVIKRNPLHSKNWLMYTKEYMFSLPIDRTACTKYTSVFDLTRSSSPSPTSFMRELNGINSPLPAAATPPAVQYEAERQHKYKRTVSETKKKFVASSQEWRCKHCRQQLDHTFEIDHIVRLDCGGSNDASNLVALCRNCHGKKTAQEHM